jgi:four helix bundle protein
MSENHFDRLDAYRLAVRFTGQVWPVVRLLQRRERQLGEQLSRAATAIPLNVGEGAGEFSPGDKAHFYRYALRSAAECIAILDVAREIGLLPDEQHRPLRHTTGRLVAMLTRLVQITAARKRPGAPEQKEPPNPDPYTQT